MLVYLGLSRLYRDSPTYNIRRSMGVLPSGEEFYTQEYAHSRESQILAKTCEKSAAPVFGSFQGFQEWDLKTSQSFMRVSGRLFPEEGKEHSLPRKGVGCRKPILAVGTVTCFSEPVGSCCSGKKRRCSQRRMQDSSSRLRDQD